MSSQPTVNAAAATLAEILDELPITQKEFSKSTGIPEAHLSGLKKGTRRFTPEYDLRISRYLRQSEGFWLRMQMSTDLRKAKAKQPKIKKTVRPISDELLTA